MIRVETRSGIISVEFMRKRSCQESAGSGLTTVLFIFMEAGDVVALDLGTGYERWRNRDFGGSLATGVFVFSSSGKLYLSGYLGPDFFVVDKNGRTISRVKSMSLAEYHVHRSCRTAWAWMNAHQTLLVFDIFFYQGQGVFTDCCHKITV